MTVWLACTFTLCICLYLCGRRLQCTLTGRSHSGSRWLSPRSGPGSGRASRSCCSDPGSRVEPRVWSPPSPPGPGWRRSAAESEYSPGSPSAWTLCLLKIYKHCMAFMFFHIMFLGLRFEMLKFKLPLCLKWPSLISQAISVKACWNEN